MMGRDTRKGKPYILKSACEKILETTSKGNYIQIYLNWHEEEPTPSQGMRIKQQLPPPASISSATSQDGC